MYPGLGKIEKGREVFGKEIFGVAPIVMTSTDLGISRS